MSNKDVLESNLEISNGAIKLVRCQSCGHWCNLRPLVCPQCGSSLLELCAASGLGRVKSLTVVYRAPDAVWRLKVPYTVALVQTDEGPVLMGHADQGIQIGDHVRAHHFAHGDQQLICFVKCDKST